MTEALDAARAALQQGDFDSALVRLRGSLVPDADPDAHDLYANLLFALDDTSGARRHWEIAFRLYRDDGRRGPAVKAACHLVFLHYGVGNEAASRGWVNRARRLADAGGRCVERGYVELALLACDVRDATALEASAQLALDLALEFGDSELEARALADGGLALITQGRLQEGFARLDEAMAPISAGEINDPGIAGMIFCALLTACERTGDLRRAEEWTRACDAHREALLFGKFPVLYTHCRLAYGRVLCDAGRLDDAEAELAHSLGPAGTSVVAKRAEASAIFANLRLQQGRLEDAEHLLSPYLDRFEICDPLARLHAARGEFDLAVATVRRALHELVNDRLRGGPLLGLLVEIELARGNLDEAAGTSRELSECASLTQSAVLAAEARLAEGRCALATGDTVRAVELLETGRDVLADDQRPLLTARIRLELAAAFGAMDRAADAIDEARVALTILERMGATRDADRAAALLRTLGAPGRTKARLDGTLTQREHDVLDLVRQGLTNAEIAARLFITPKTAEHHVSRILAKLGVRSRAEAAAAAVSGVK